MTGARRKAMRGVLAIAVGAALLSGVPLGAGDRQDAAAAADACPAPASLGRVQVLVELADMPALRAYEAALASASAGEPAAREAAARAAERAQDQKVKEAHAAAARELAALGARELYRVRRSFNGISVVVDAHKLDALRGLPGVKAVYRRTSGAAEAALVPAESAAGTSPAASRTAAPGAGLRAYGDPTTGRLTEAPSEAPVRELDKGSHLPPLRPMRHSGLGQGGVGQRDGGVAEPREELSRSTRRGQRCDGLDGPLLPGQTRGNNAIVPLGELAVRCSQASGTAYFILDVNGYFE
jgi:Peptidase inhibitor I9